MKSSPSIKRATKGTKQKNPAYRLLRYGKRCSLSVQECSFCIIGGKHYTSFTPCMSGLLTAISIPVFETSSCRSISGLWVSLHTGRQEPGVAWLKITAWEKCQDGRQLGYWKDFGRSRRKKLGACAYGGAGKYDEVFTRVQTGCTWSEQWMLIVSVAGRTY